jgi:hypothetical protein
LTRYREIHNYVQNIQYTITCTQYVNNEEEEEEMKKKRCKEEQFNGLSLEYTYRFIYVLNEFAKLDQL